MARGSRRTVPLWCARAVGPPFRAPVSAPPR
uniref:Uncharacterized protein n=1 Tax=Arundo donax TaxID=35708 RepID=A0A0A9C7Q8_ARUDO